MTTKLRTVDAIKKVLGDPIMQQLRALDGTKHERKATSEARRSLASFAPDDRGRLACRACGQLSPAKTVAAAHIIGIWEGGQTRPEDLVPLCSRSKRSVRAANRKRLVKQLGCHELYDNCGLLSQQEAMQLNSKPRPWPDVRKRMEKRALEVDADTFEKYVRIGDPRRQLNELSARLRTMSTNELVEVASRARRWPIDEALALAERALRIAKRRGASGSKFWYEMGYLALWRNQFHNARSCFERAYKAAKSDVKRDLSRALLLQIDVVTSKPTALRGVQGDLMDVEYRRLLDPFLRDRVATNRVEYNRGMSNALIHRARLHIKRRHWKRAEVTLREWRSFWRSLHAANGWTASSVNLANVTFGLLARSRSSGHFRLLCLGIRQMLQAPKQAPEEIRDGLRHLGRLLGGRLGKRVRAVSSCIMDPLSGILF